MNIETTSQSQEELLAAAIFDRFVEAKRSGDIAQDLGHRAVAAAHLLAATHQENDWFVILDSALQERGLDAHYSDLSPYRLRAESRMASDALTPLTRRCRTIIQELTTLSLYEGQTDLPS